jgi:enamine deaminase RidA (YjgF/YER057c/UK114 family)
MVGAQVVIEATSAERRAVNPNAVIFLPSAEATDPAGPVGYLRQRARTNEMLRVTCFLSSMENTASTQAAVTAAFPGAAVDIVQPQRQSLRSYAACEGVARQTGPQMIAGSFASKQQVLDTVKMMGYYAQSPKVIFTSTKLVFREEDADIRLAFQRLEKALEPLGAKPQDIFWTSIYALTNPVGVKTAALVKDVVGPNAVGPGASMLFEGLPSTDATAAIELIAVGH